MCFAVTASPLMISNTATGDTSSRADGGEILARHLRQCDDRAQAEDGADPREQRAAVDLLWKDGERGGDHHPREPYGDEDLPADRHQPVVAESRDRRARPYEDEDQRAHLPQEPHDWP